VLPLRLADRVRGAAVRNGIDVQQRLQEMVAPNESQPVGQGA
jgi:hypothetical protein